VLLLPPLIAGFISCDNYPNTGGVGSGKTTFLHYTSKVSAAKIIKEKILWLYINFKKATESDDPRTFLYKELLELIEEDVILNLGSWKESIEPAYQDLINKMIKGPLSLIYKDDKKEFNKEITNIITKERDNLEPYIDRILRYASTKRPIYIIVDNIDQIENEEHQTKIFNESQAIARRSKSNVIISLREATYLKHRNSPVFDAFQLDTIYIDPPKVIPVLSRRFVYAKRFLKNKEAEILSESGIRFKVKDLSVFFGIVSESLLSQDSGFLLESLSGGDVRRGLLLVREFLASGHISANAALQTYLTEGKYKFPMHEVFKGALLGQRKYYREEDSLLFNIFDSKLGKLSLQLLRLQLLLVLIEFSYDSSFEGFNLESITSDLYRIGVSNNEIMRVIKTLISSGAIRTSDGNPLMKDSMIVPTRLGGYLILKLGYTFMYLEPCLMDACIYDEGTWSQLFELTENIESSIKMKRIQYRIERAKIFLNYLNNIEQNWIVNCKRFKLQNYWEKEIIGKQIIPKAEKQFEWVLHSAEKQYKKEK